MTKFYIIAGEASGDMHGANLIKELKKQHSNSEYRAWGGDRMKEEGANVVKHYRDLAFMGFLEVIMNLRTILGNIKACKSDIEKYKPDALILIDYPGFNMRIGEFAKKKGLKVFYYISPQVWAWKKDRVKKLKKMVDRMFVILPFEKDFYSEYEMEVDYVGHPLLDEIANGERQIISSEKPILALLPGSRKQEIKKLLPVMLEAVREQSKFQIAVAAAPSVSLLFYKEMVQDDQVQIIENRTYDLLHSAKYALVTSGTATLEAALFRVPQVVCYKGSAFSYAIAKRLVDIKYISLVNLIMDSEVVKELIQKECSVKNIQKELELLQDPEKSNEIVITYAQLKEKLGGKGASGITAKLLLRSMGLA